MKLTKNILPREIVLACAPDYVAFIEEKHGSYEAFDKIFDKFNAMKKGNTCISFHDGQYFKCKVTSVDDECMQAIDGPVIRISNGEYSWRCDGDKYAYPIK